MSNTKRDFRWMWIVWWTGQSRRRQRFVCRLLNRVFWKLPLYRIGSDEFVWQIIGVCNEYGIYLEWDGDNSKFRVRRYRDIFKDGG